MSVSDNIYSFHLAAIYAAKAFAIAPFYFFSEISEDLPVPVRIGAIILGVILSIPTLVVSYVIQLVLVISGLIFGTAAALIEAAAEACTNYCY